MTQPLVSIILTVYDTKLQYLQECIESLLQQTHKNIEIIVIDDASPNTTYDHIVNFSNKIKLHRNPENLKMNKSVNKGFDLSTGKYVVRLGSDDIFHNEMLEKEVTYLENHPEVGAVCCELKRFGCDQHQHIRRPKVWDYNNIVNNRIFAGTGYAGGMMFRHELLEFCSIDENFKMCEDFDFHLQLLKHMPIASIHEVLYYYRSHETNLCKSVSRQERWALLDKIIAKHKN